MVMKKDELLAKAEELNVDVAGLPWHEQVKAVYAAMEEDSSFSAPKPEPKAAKKENVFVPKAAKVHGKILGIGDVIISPELKPTRVQPYKYEEELDEELIVEEPEAWEGMSRLEETGRNGFTGLHVTGKKNKKTVAQSTLPKQNDEIKYEPDHWYAPVVKSFDGRQGYLWSHHSLKGIKQLLLDCGNYDKYAELFDSKKFPSNIWMSSKFYVVSIPLVERIFKEIEENAARR